MCDDLQERFDLLLNRLETSYDGIGHSSGRPYIYFVYPLAKERQLEEQLKTHTTLAIFCIDVLKITISGISGQEKRCRQFLDDPLHSKNQMEAIHEALEELPAGKRPVVVLSHLAAPHPLGDPTSLMEFRAEQEPRNSVTGTIIPIVLLVPDSRPPQSTRTDLFLDQVQLDFYRGEES